MVRMRRTDRSLRMPAGVADFASPMAAMSSRWNLAYRLVLKRSSVAVGPFGLALPGPDGYTLLARRSAVDRLFFLAVNPTPKDVTWSTGPLVGGLFQPVYWSTGVAAQAIVADHVASRRLLEAFPAFGWTVHVLPGVAEGMADGIDRLHVDVEQT